MRGYRAATEALDERPSAATRAAILAAAARQVQAAPRDAREPIAAPRVTPRRRWPYAAAAAVLLSSLAVMMATRTEREMPTFTAPVERMAENAAPSKPVPSSEPPPPAAAPPASQEIASTSASVPARAEKQAKADSSRAGASDRSGRGESRAGGRSATRKGGSRRPAGYAGTRHSTAAIGELRMRRRPRCRRSWRSGRRHRPAKRRSAVATRALTWRARSVRSCARRRRRRPPPVSVPPRVRCARTLTRQSRPSASEWLERIIKLRRAGRHDEADVELKRFRESFPQVTVPAEALPATGTR